MTGKYLDTTGLSYLWDKITAAFASKELLTGSINNKVDKISTSTDNAVVRFNGTSSAIQNSGVTINDSNHVTAAKFITSGGTSSQFVKGDGSLDTHNYMKIKKLPTSGAYISQSGCYLKLVMPNPLSSWMMTLGVAVYSGYASEIYYIGGYNYQNSTKTWHSPSVILLSSSTSSRKVYFGKNDYDGGDGKLWVAIPLSSYSHASLMENSNNGYTFDIAEIEYSTLDANPDNWDTSTLGTINHILTVTSSTGYLPLSGGTMSGKITFLTGNREILHFAGSDTTWGAGLKYSWSNKTAIAFWGQHAETAFIWNAGTNYASTDIPSTGTNYDFKIQRVSGTPKVSTTGDFVGNSFIKSGGTSSQFLKADGSIDSNTYLTTAPVTSVNGQTGAVNITIPTDVSDDLHQLESRVDEIEEVTAAALNDLNTSLNNKIDYDNLAYNVERYNYNPVTSSAVYTAILNVLNSIPTVPITSISVNGVTLTITNKNVNIQIPSGYTKPSTGIPKSDLATDVQASLNKADTALLSFTESDPTVPSYVKSITQLDINNWNAKLGDIDDVLDSESTNPVENQAIYNELYELSADNNGHGYVDFGLPSGTLWATTNVGATNPEDYGNYYAWGETLTKTNYATSTYAHGTSLYNLTKYNSTDGLTTLEAEDDAPHVLWGGGWQIPTIDQIQELVDYCTCVWGTVNGINGYTISGNGNSIFLPAAGSRFNTSSSDVGSFGYYWSSSLNIGNTGYANFLYFYNSYHNADHGPRHYGYSIRPVITPAKSLKFYTKAESDQRYGTGGSGGGTGSGTVTSVGLTMPSQFTVSGSPITTNGTLSVSLNSSYSIPTTTQVTTWNNKQDAISDLATIRSNASAGAAKVSNVQSDWDATSGLAQILNKPTTLSGYGITDASISNNTVTLGSNSVTVPTTSDINTAIQTAIGTSSVAIYTGTTAPSSSQGSDGDIYIQTT